MEVRDCVCEFSAFAFGYFPVAVNWGRGGIKDPTFDHLVVETLIHVKNQQVLVSVCFKFNKSLIKALVHEFVFGFIWLFSFPAAMTCSHSKWLRDYILS